MCRLREWALVRSCKQSTIGRQKRKLVPRGIFPIEPLLSSVLLHGKRFTESDVGQQRICYQFSKNKRETIYGNYCYKNQNKK